MARVARPKQNVAVVYHFFAHYRGPVMRELLEKSEHRFILVGDRKDVDDGTIKAMEIPDPARFVLAPCRYRPLVGMVQKGLLRLALRRDLDAVIYLGNAAWISTWLSAVVARLTGKHVLFWTHGWTERDQGAKRLIRNTFYRLAHGLLLYGHWAKMIAMEQGFPPQRLYVIYNSLDYERQKAARQRMTCSRIPEIRQQMFSRSDLPVMICTTRLTKTRRLDLVFEAMRMLRDQGRETALLLVGDGPERGPLEALAESLGIMVRFYGPCYDEEILGELIMSANVAVSPGAIGLTAIHSLAFGTPVITHDDPEDQGPEWESIVPGKTGSVFRRGDVADLARAIEAWTRNSLPDESVREACHEVVERFYNPQFQRMAIDRAVCGEPADDLFWMKS